MFSLFCAPPASPPVVFPRLLIFCFASFPFPFPRSHPSCRAFCSLRSFRVGASRLLPLFVAKSAGTQTHASQTRPWGHDWERGVPGGFRKRRGRAGCSFHVSQANRHARHRHRMQENGASPPTPPRQVPGTCCLPPFPLKQTNRGSRRRQNTERGRGHLSPRAKYAPTGDVRTALRPPSKQTHSRTRHHPALEAPPATCRGADNIRRKGERASLAACQTLRLLGACRLPSAHQASKHINAQHKAQAPHSKGQRAFVAAPPPTRAQWLFSGACRRGACLGLVAAALGACRLPSPH